MKNTHIYGFSNKGKGHRGKKNQDYIIYNNSDNFVIAVICDGVSSCKYSDEGARLTAKETQDFLSHNFDVFYNEPQLQKKILLENINNKLENISIKKETNIKEFSSTLGFVIIKDGKYICGQMGDGIVGIYQKNNPGKKLLPSKESELPNSSTYTVVNDSDNLEVVTGEYTDTDGFLLATDGLNNIIYYENSEYLTKESKYLMSGKKLCIKKKLFEYSWKTMDDISFIAITKKNKIYKTIHMSNKWLCSCGHHNLFEEIACPHCHEQYADLYVKNKPFYIRDKNVFFYTLDQYTLGKISKLKGVELDNEIEFYNYINRLCKINNRKITELQFGQTYYKINIDNKVYYLIKDESNVFHKIKPASIPIGSRKNIIDISSCINSQENKI